MLNDYLFIGIFMVIAIVFPALPVVIAMVVRPRKPNALKNETYECGIETVGDTWVQFKVRFFALVFWFRRKHCSVTSALQGAQFYSAGDGVVPLDPRRRTIRWRWALWVAVSSMNLIPGAADAVPGIVLLRRTQWANSLLICGRTSCSSPGCGRACCATLTVGLAHLGHRRGARAHRRDRGLVRGLVLVIFTIWLGAKVAARFQDRRGQTRQAARPAQGGDTINS
jgi:hypothetical protein